MDGLSAVPDSTSTETAMDFDAVVIGAGVSGLYQLYRLRELRLGCACSRPAPASAAPGIGTTSRAPASIPKAGPMGISFSQELLEEWDWEEHFAAQPETERYLNYVADKFDLRRDIQCRSRVTAAHYQEETRSWTLSSRSGRRSTTRLLITAIGVLSAATMPTPSPRRDIQGQSCHTHYWPKDTVRFAGQRVAVIGTGATGVQTITEVAKDRRPSGRLSSAPPVVCAIAQRQDRQGGDEPDPVPDSCRDSCALPGDLRLLHPCDRPACHLRGDRRGA